MNTLSWAIYGISSLDKFNSELREFSSGALLFMIVFGIIKGVAFLMNSDGYSLSNENYKKVSSFIGKVYKVAVPVWLIATVLHIIVPDRKTMIMVAASEVGDKIIANKNLSGELIDPSIDLLKTYVKTELEKQRDELSKIMTDGKKKVLDKVEDSVHNMNK